MVYIVLYTQAAHNDLVSIYDYIAHDLLEPIVAGNLINNIKNAIYSLSTFPWRHQKCELLQAQKEERRQFAVNGYIVIYEIDEHNKTVNIIRIVCEKRNLTNMVN